MTHVGWILNLNDQNYNLNHKNNQKLKHFTKIATEFTFLNVWCEWVYMGSVSNVMMMWGKGVGLT